MNTVVTTAVPRVLVGVDGSRAAEKAVTWAAHAAAAREIGLEIVHAGAPDFEAQLSENTWAAVRTELGERARTVLHAAAQAAHDAEPGLDVALDIYDGDPVEYLLDRSRTAPLLVLGSASRDRVLATILRSVGQTVAAHAHCPTVVVNQLGPRNAVPKPQVVVGVSTSAAGQAALRWAFCEAERRNLDLLAVRAWADLGFGTADLGVDGGLFHDLENVEAKVLDRCLAAVAPQFPTVTVRRKLAPGRVHWALHHESIGAQLLVVGCHRPDDHWFSRLGPVASWLLHHAPCPLALVGRAVDAPDAPVDLTRSAAQPV